MRRSVPTRSVLGAALVAGLLGACQSISAPDISGGRIVGGATRQVHDVSSVSGFLPQPALLQPGGSGDPALIYRNPGVDSSHYGALILDPVSVWAGSGSAFTKTPVAEQQALANKFTSDLAAALRTRCRVTTQPGPGVLRVRIALVDAHPANATMNTIATYVPFVSAAYSGASYAFNKDIAYFAGSATVEGYVTDTSSGTVLWQAVDKRAGETSVLENTLDPNLDINHAFEAWSKDLAARLQRLGICRR